MEDIYKKVSAIDLRSSLTPLTDIGKAELALSQSGEYSQNEVNLTRFTELFFGLIQNYQQALGEHYPSLYNEIESGMELVLESYPNADLDLIFQRLVQSRTAVSTLSADTSVRIKSTVIAINNICRWIVEYIPGRQNALRASLNNLNSLNSSRLIRYFATKLEAQYVDDNGNLNERYWTEFNSMSSAYIIRILFPEQGDFVAQIEELQTRFPFLIQQEPIEGTYIDGQGNKVKAPGVPHTRAHNTTLLAISAAGKVMHKGQQGTSATTTSYTQGLLDTSNQDEADDSGAMEYGKTVRTEITSAQRLIDGFLDALSTLADYPNLSDMLRRQGRWIFKYQFNYKREQGTRVERDPEFIAYNRVVDEAESITDKNQRGAVLMVLVQRLAYYIYNNGITLEENNLNYPIIKEFFRVYSLMQYALVFNDNFGTIAGAGKVDLEGDELLLPLRACIISRFSALSVTLRPQNFDLNKSTRYRFEQGQYQTDTIHVDSYHSLLEQTAGYKYVLQNLLNYFDSITVNFVADNSHDRINKTNDEYYNQTLEYRAHIEQLVQQLTNPLIMIGSHNPKTYYELVAQIAVHINRQTIRGYKVKLNLNEYFSEYIRLEQNLQGNQGTSVFHDKARLTTFLPQLLAELQKLEQALVRERANVRRGEH